MYGNWTQEEVRKVVITALEIECKDCVNLDVERADSANIMQIITWCRSMGYSAECKDDSEVVTVRKSN